MKYAIFACLDDLLNHICANLHWNGKNVSQIVYDEDGVCVASLCEENNGPFFSFHSTAVWLDGVKLVDGINNPENVLYITAVHNLHSHSIETSKENNLLAVIEINGELDLHSLVESSHLELIHTVIEDD